MQQIDVVGAVIVNEQSEVLCALRSQQMSQPGYWEFPGGKIEPGETPAESLRREIAWLPRTRLASLRWAPADLPTVDRLTGETE